MLIRSRLTTTATALACLFTVAAAPAAMVAPARAAPPAPAPAPAFDPAVQPAPHHPTAGNTTADPRTPDRTSAVEAARVDRVPTPKLSWKTCFSYAQCATVRVPLDYDDPTGATTSLAVLRVKARDQQKKIGSLFVNPGGPGAQGTAIALSAPNFLGDAVLDRFDIVGVDPRGVGLSENVRCFPSTEAQTAATTGMNVPFPFTRAEEKAYIASAKAVGRACSSTGTPLSGAMSTAEVARDMDVLRRAVGDRKLSFLGFSYGSVLGQYYANMFPDRVRAVVIDGVVNPVSWVGDKKTQDTIQDERLRSSDGAQRAVREILVRCGRVGAELCPFAAAGDPVRNFDLIATRLRIKPAVFTLPGGDQFTVSFAEFMVRVLGALYSPNGYAQIVALAHDVLTVTDPVVPATAERRIRAQQAVAQRMTGSRPVPAADEKPAYDNASEPYAAVTCTDGRHPADASLWPKLLADADKRAPYFGRAWGWGSATCARATWTVRDEDAFVGPFTHRTSAPVLVVGNYWDPATNYQDAVGAARLLPGSRLLSSDSWGHTAYGTSRCVTGAVDAYLVGGALPARDLVCTGDVQPFTNMAGDRRADSRASRPTASMAQL
ncbi:MAG TPA: alpha/beta fold hydrolase, partial [Catenuloplanes sp.]